MSSQAGIHQYAEQSILSEGNWVKIRVSGTGVCRMRFDQIRQAGLNPQQLRVFGYGGAQLEQDFTKTKIDDLPQVPVYVGDDYVLFWVQGPYSWQYSGPSVSYYPQVIPLSPVHPSSMRKYSLLMFCQRIQHMSFMCSSSHRKSNLLSIFLCYHSLKIFLPNDGEHIFLL